jgi:hypothetical protein
MQAIAPVMGVFLPAAPAAGRHAACGLPLQPHRGQFTARKGAIRPAWRLRALASSVCTRTHQSKQDPTNVI